MSNLRESTDQMMQSEKSPDIEVKYAHNYHWEPVFLGGE